MKQEVNNEQRQVCSEFSVQFYDKGRNDMKKELFDKGMPCIMGWYDGFVPEFNQEQINELAEKQGINVGDKIRVIIVKDE